MLFEIVHEGFGVECDLIVGGQRAKEPGTLVDALKGFADFFGGVGNRFHCIRDFGEDWLQTCQCLIGRFKGGCSVQSHSLR